jgi:hypothetical protein
MRAEGHNTLVIAPDAKPDQDPRASAVIGKFERNLIGAYAEADLTPAYRHTAKRVFRSVRRSGAEFVEIQDEVTPKAESDLWWFAHTGAAITLSPDGRRAVLRQQGKSLTVLLNRAPAGVRFEDLPAQPLPGLPNPEQQNANRGMRKLAFRVHTAEPVQWTVRFTPDL